MLGLVLGILLGVHGAQPDDVVALAAEYQIDDPRELQAASDTVGVTPSVYLRTTPPHAPPPPPATPSAPVAGIWARLAACESTGNWRANTGNGYYGGVQQDMTFWRRYGGLAFAPRPDLASPAQQVVVAERGLAVQGWGAWPVCSRRLGLR